VVPENLHGRFRVGIERRFETKLGDPDFLEEGFDCPDQIPQRQVVVGNETLDLVELAKVGRVHRLVPEDAVDREVAGGLESTFLVGQLVQHLGRYGGGVGPQQIFHRLLPFEIIPVSNRTGSAHLVHRLDAFVVLLGNLGGVHGFLDEESVVRVTGWMGLGLEQGIKVPERGFHPLVRRHFLEPHLHENLSEFRPDLEERVEVPAPYLFPQRHEVVGLEGGRLPGPGIQHLLRQVGRFLLAFRSVLRSSFHLEGFSSVQPNQFPPLQALEDLRCPIDTEFEGLVQSAHVWKR